MDFFHGCNESLAKLPKLSVGTLLSGGRILQCKFRVRYVASYGISVLSRPGQSRVTWLDTSLRIYLSVTPGIGCDNFWDLDLRALFFYRERS